MKTVPYTTLRSRFVFETRSWVMRTYSKLSGFMVAVALVATACGSGDDGSAADAAGATSAVGSAANAAFNDADVTFAQGMIPHHEQAVEMAEIALDPTVGASAQVRGLAARIKTAQDPEIQLMGGWLKAWGRPMQMDMSSDQMESMEGMMSTAGMASLGGAQGSSFDAMWSQMMIEHHQGAIAMAKTLKAEGSDPAVAKLADAIITAQQAEIDEINNLPKG